MSILNKLDKFIKFEEVSAHCDIPCGIYDPIKAQISALTTVRMIDLMEKEDSSDKRDATHKNKMARYVETKEVHAEEAKHEVRIIWGDFIKGPHIEKHPNLNGLVHEIMVLGSKVKQGVKRETAVEFVNKVNEFAEIFWAIKGLETVKAEAPYAPNLELVYRKI